MTREFNLSVFGNTAKLILGWGTTKEDPAEENNGNPPVLLLTCLDSPLLGRHKLVVI